MDRLRVAWRETNENNIVDWQAHGSVGSHSGYPKDLVPGSPEHSGAHDRLLELAVEMESDFEPYGKRSRDGGDSVDCSCGCRHYAILAGALGADWGICMNKYSPRAGLLTFEHQGCPAFEAAANREELPG
jgi:hypothetical protein